MSFAFNIASAAKVHHADIVAFGFDKKLSKAFIELSEIIYKSDRLRIQPLKSSILQQLDETNPWYQRGEACHFLLPGAGRISAFHTADSAIGYVGFFECIENFGVAERLLASAVGWLHGRGSKIVRGPINFDTWHSYRFVTKGSEFPPFFLEPYHPPYYPTFWERYGFAASARYCSHQHDDMSQIVAALEPHYQKALRSAFTFRPLDLGRWSEELRLYHELSCEIFRANWGYTPLGFSEFARLYAASRPLLDTGMSWFAQDRAGHYVGFIFGLPDHSRAIRAMRGASGPVGAMRFLGARRKPTSAILKTLGVLPAARGSNVGFALGYLFHRQLLEQGYQQAIHALMLDDNASRRMSFTKGGRMMREYAVFDLTL
ncbi:MAG: hypothetical protein HY692_07185 [Cyanobacteria bacterium NC_groundwater_1444_Ag_S-0.65um_54_12]|nr:hypothetical protein [Cyanobacteria bacterium NC_groundwater_1444_Ag_S-0.65um_54_12]